MEFGLSDEHRLIRDFVREFCEEEIEPIAQEIEDEHRFPREIFDQLGALDVMGVPISEEWGGLGGETLLYALVAEELGRVSGSVGLSYVAHVSLGTKPIELFGTDRQKGEWLEPLATGEELGAWALTEPESGSDASDMNTRARKDGDEYVIDGTKQFITNANVANSILLKAVTDPEAGTDGISTFILDPDQPGVEVTTVWDKMGLNASPTSSSSSTRCEYPNGACSARRAPAGTRPRQPSLAAGSPWRRCPWGSHRGPSRRHSSTQRNASSLASRSESSTPSGTCSSRWTARSSARGC